MGLGLYLEGRLRGAVDDPLAAIERFFRGRYGPDLMDATTSHDDDGRALVQLTTHPGAEPIEVTLEDGKVIVSAKTSTVGPGYHADECEAFHAVGAALGIAWTADDETGYFTSGDQEALEDEMLAWVRALAGALLEHVRDGAANLAVSMPTQPHFRGPPGAAVLTQTGPRTEAWLERVHQDPGAGKDLFPWWEPGRGAAYELGRALVHLWMDVRFHPAATETEERVAREVVERLERAYQLDPELAYPWSAWSELYETVLGDGSGDTPALVRARAARDDEPPAGYRRWDVEEMLPGGFRVTLPGSFSVEVDDEGTWSAWEGDRTVWVTSFSFTKDGAPPTPEEILADRKLANCTSRSPERCCSSP